jgi:hypothetical protein
MCHPSPASVSVHKPVGVADRAGRETERMASIDVAGWTGPWPEDDPDGSFKERVAASARLDPLATLANLSEAVGIPVGGIVHHVLAEWASAGSRGLLELGATEVDQLWAIVEGDEPATDKIEALRGASVLVAGGHVTKLTI